jgi:hypothetical protein
MAHQHRRVSVGFQGGQVLSLRVTDEQLETEEGPVRLYLGQVVYVRLEDSDRGVGFSV